MINSSFLNLEKVVKASLLTLSLFVAYFIFSYSMASLYNFKLEAYLERWSHNNSVNSDELLDAINTSNKLLSWHPNHPHYLNVVGKVYEWQAFKVYKQEPEYSEALLKAYDYYIQSSLLRPMWPNTWVDLARIKADFNQFDSEFFLFINKSLDTGPYTRVVNMTIAKLQLKYWHVLPKEFYSIGIEQIKRSLMHKRKRLELLYYAHNVGRVSVVCSLAKINKVEYIVRHKLCN